MEDERFAHIIHDPKYRRIPKTERKVKIDKRFKSMFKDKNFKVKYTVDKRGRPVSHTSTEDLKRYYELDSDVSSEDSENEASNNGSGQYVKAASFKGDEGNNQLNVKHKCDKKVSEDVKKKLQNLNIDYARGESNLLSESSSDDEEDSEIDESETLEHAWGTLDNDADRTEEITNRLAACNMDWDRIKAMDLMVLLNSFLPPGGVIESVKIYPSEFGKERMKEEEVKGPVELVDSKSFQNNQEEEEDEDEGEGSKYHMEKLRQYQLNRLKYYYAVIVFNNINAANKIYSECDGLEYESSATKMDLRFIPDDMIFEDEPKEVCEKLPEEGKYKPRFFTTTALQQAKVDLTWDETDPDRIEFTQKLAAGDNVEVDDLGAYLASSSNDEDDDDGKDLVDTIKNSKLNAIDKYKALLQDIENKEKEKEKGGVEMEVSWDLDLKDKTESLVKKKLNEKEETTPFQQYLNKRKEKQISKREERKKKHFIENEIDNDSDIPSHVDMNDPYFAEEFSKPGFEQKSKMKASTSTRDAIIENNNSAAELELLVLNTEDDKNHFNLKNIYDCENKNKSKKRIKKNETIKDDNFKINVEDARFSALYTSHHYNVDPTDPHYKNTKGMEAIVNEKLKRRGDSAKELFNTSKKDVELNVLVKSIKRKTEAFGNKKKQKI